jgi:transposase
MGYNGSIQTLRRFLSGLLAPQRRTQQTSVRFETPSGKQAQIDWAECEDTNNKADCKEAFVDDSLKR